MEIEQTNKTSIFKKPWLQSLIAIVVIFGSLAIFLFWQASRNTVLVENSYLEAPMINLSGSTAGILNALYVTEGEKVSANSPVALVGSQIIYTKTAGIVADAAQVIGNYFAPGQTVVSVIDNQEMKVVGAVDETKGLNVIKIGERATFTVDAFPGKNYEGVVSEISPTSNDNSVVFSISDKRPVRNFNIKVSFDVAKYPELINGLSAKITVHTAK